MLLVCGNESTIRHRTTMAGASCCQAQTHVPVLLGRLVDGEHSQETQRGGRLECVISTDVVVHKGGRPVLRQVHTWLGNNNNAVSGRERDRML